MFIKELFLYLEYELAEDARAAIDNMVSVYLYSLSSIKCCYIFLRTLRMINPLSPMSTNYF